MSGATNAGGAKREDRFMKIALVGLLCLFTLSAYTLGYARRELDIDELWTIEVTEQPLKDMVLQERWTIEVKKGPLRSEVREMMATTLYPPFYYFLLKLWGTIAGLSVFSCRLFSLVFALWSIYLIYRLGSELYTNQEGFWAALLLTVSNFHLHYATEIRMYSMVVALSLLSSLWFFRAFIQGGDKKSWYGYFITTLLLTWTNHYTWLLVGSQGAYLLLRAEKERWHALKPWLRTISILLLLTLPWVILLVRYFARNRAQVLGDLRTLQLVGAHRLSGAAYLIGAFNGMLPIQHTTRYGFLPWSVPFLVLLWQRRYFRFHSILEKATELVRASIASPTEYLLLALVIPITCLTLISSAILPLFIPRYLIYCLPVYYLIVSHCAVSSCSKWRGQLLVLLPPLLWSITSAASLRLFL